MRKRKMMMTKMVRKVMRRRRRVGSRPVRQRMSPAELLCWPPVSDLQPSASSGTWAGSWPSRCWLWPVREMRDEHTWKNDVQGLRTVRTQRRTENLFKHPDRRKF